MDPNREFAELVGLCRHENDPPPIYTMEYGIVLVCKCGFKTQSLIELNKHIKESNPNYASDPRLVLREMVKREDFPLFMARLMYMGDSVEGIDWDHNIDIDYILDANFELETTGKIRDEAIEFLKEER